MALLPNNLDSLPTKPGQEDLLKKQASKLGLASPITPMGASSLGVNPDSAKMAGTGGQKMAAIKKEAPILSSSLTPVEKKVDSKRSTATDLFELKQAGSGLQDRVQSLLVGQFNKQATGAAERTGDYLDSLVTSLRLNNPTSSNSLKKLMNGESLSEPEYISLGQEKNLGVAAQDFDGLKLALDTKFKPDAGKLPLVVQNNFKVADVKQGNTNWTQELGLGFDNEEQLASFLGIDVGVLDSKTIKELNDSVDNKVAAEFSQFQAAQAQLQDPLASANDKQAASSYLRSLGVGGVLASERMAEDATEATRRMEGIKFRGETYSPEELVTSDIFNTEASNFYKLDDEGRERFINKLTSSEDKAFYQYLKANEEALQAISQTTGGVLTKEKEEQQKAGASWAAVSQLGVPDELLPILLGQQKAGGFGKMDASKITNFGKILTDTQVPVEVRGALAAFFKNVPADRRDYFKNIDMNEMTRLGVYKPGMSPNLFERTLNKWKDLVDLQMALNPEKYPDPSTQDMLGIIGIGSQEAHELVAALDNFQNMTAEMTRLKTLLDSNKDGKLDSPLVMQKTLRDAFGGMGINTDNDNPTTIFDNVKDWNQSFTGGFKNLGPIMNDGLITDEEVANSNLELSQYINNPLKPFIKLQNPSSFYDRLVDKEVNKLLPEFNSIMTNQQGLGSNPDFMRQKADELLAKAEPFKSDPEAYNRMTSRVWAIRGRADAVAADIERGRKQTAEKAEIERAARAEEAKRRDKELDRARNPLQPMADARDSLIKATQYPTAQNIERAVADYASLPAEQAHHVLSNLLPPAEKAKVDAAIQNTQKRGASTVKNLKKGKVKW
jgi:hypothetical protein